MKMSKENIRYIIYAVFCIIIGISAYFIGNNNSKEKSGYEYIKSERLDSLEKADSLKSISIESIKNETESLRTKIDGTKFTTQEEINKIIGDERDELYNKMPSRIDTLFIIGYDSAIGARRFIYN